MAIVSPTQRCRLFLLPLWAAVCGGAQADKPLVAVADLRYGAALYEYYQGNYFEALSELMVAEARGGVRGHSDNPKLIEGGISLSFGMESKAGKIFGDLLTADGAGKFARPRAVRNAAWFYLGKLRYLRGDWDGTRASFANISGRLDRDLLPEMETLSINLAIRRNDLKAAEKTLDRARNVDNSLHYVYYNLGNAYSRSQQYKQAIRYYNRLLALPLSELPSAREEQLVLYDRAMTAAGYSHVLQGEAERAIDRFSRVRLDSPFAHRALLGYGWAAVAAENFQLALKPWEELRRRSLVFAPTQEAYLAVPYAYEKLAAPGQALQAYAAADSAFEQEIERIDAVLAQVNQLDMLSALNIREIDNRNWFLLDRETGVEPHLTYLAELFSLNHFQSSVQELRDLVHMQNLLAGWREKLDAYNYMLDVREQHRARQVEDIEQRNLDAKLARLVALRNRLSNRLDQITAEKDYLALAEGVDKENHEIVQTMEANLAKLKRAGEPVADYEAQVKRYKGLLFWDAAENFAARRWHIRDQINALDKAIVDAQNNLARFNREMLEAPDIAPYRTRIELFTQRLNTQSERVEDAVLLAENTLRLKVTEELAGQKQRLQHYLAQARLAVARLYDLALQERRP